MDEAQLRKSGRSICNMKYDVDIKKSDVDFEKSDVDLSGGQEEGGQYPQGGRRPPEKINNENRAEVRSKICEITAGDISLTLSLDLALTRQNDVDF